MKSLSWRPRAFALGAAVAAAAIGCDPIGTVVGLYDSGPESTFEPDGAPVPFDAASGPDEGTDTGQADAPADAAPDALADAPHDALADSGAVDTGLGPDTSLLVFDSAAPPDTSVIDTGAPDTGALLFDSALPDTSAPPDTGSPVDSAATPDSTVVQDATPGMDASGGADATLHDSGTAPDAHADGGASGVDAGTITCTTTRQVITSGGCLAQVTVEDDVALYPIAWPGLGWAGALATNSSGISQLYTNNAAANPSQQFFYATDKTLALYVGYTDTPGDGGPGDWGTAHRTDNLITSFTLNVTKLGNPPPNCSVPEIAVVCSGSTTIGCQWYGGACGSGVTCCPDSVYTTPGNAGPYPVACTQDLCCNPSGTSCNTGVACCSGVCEGDGGPGTCQ